jgi:flavin-dependent dehydrogenase
LSDALIIGGGPAGAAAAILLARAGRAVTLIERNATATDKVCGDFLSAEAIAASTALGLDLAAMAPSPITTVRLVHAHRTAETRLPFAAFGLTRRAFDEALLQQASASGASLLRGHAVRAIDWHATALHIDCGVTGRITSDTVFLATGKHDLRGAARPEHGTGLVGLKMYYRLAPRQQVALGQSIELMLFSGGYAGLQPVEAGQAVLCVLVPGARLRAAGGQWDRLLDSLTGESRHLADRLTSAQPLLRRPLAVAAIPYGYVHAAHRNEAPGLFRIGDQSAVIASFTGDGVALALGSAMLAAETWLTRGNAAAYHRAWAGQLRRQMRIASVLHRACLTPIAQPWLLRACRAFPDVIRLAASFTRMGTAAISG